jgi:GT2 family glycosyltransferase
VIVVDNASADGAAAMVSEEYDWVELIANSANVGFAAANNQALRRCRTPYALLLNNDTELTRGALDGMLEFLDRTSDAGAVGCRLVDARGRWQPSASGLPTIRSVASSYFGLKRLVPASLARSLLTVGPGRRLMNLLVPGYFTPREEHPHSVEFLSGACLMARKATWVDIGLLDEDLFLYLEDSDWCRRMLAGGWNLYYLPAIEITHIGGQSFAANERGVDYRLSPERSRSVLQYFAKHERRWRVMAVRGVIVAAMGLRVLGFRFRLHRSKAAADRARLHRSVLRMALRGPEVAAGR